MWYTNVNLINPKITLVSEKINNTEKSKKAISVEILLLFILNSNKVGWTFLLFKIRTERFK